MHALIGELQERGDAAMAEQVAMLLRRAEETYAKLGAKKE